MDIKIVVLFSTLCIISMDGTKVVEIKGYENLDQLDDLALKLNKINVERKKGVAMNHPIDTIFDLTLSIVVTGI